ncbi:MAG: metallopeptidase family protein [Chloroflexota bacterium]|nr:MAG: metallopeptidase family protein [Chloroflexota bacterium]
MKRRRKTTREALGFERLVRRALDALPPEIERLMDNVAVVVEDEPEPALLAELELPPTETLFGFYQGVPQTERSSAYGMVLPDRVIIYQRPLEEACSSYSELAYEIRRTIVHEVAHHFGLDDATLTRLGWD